MPSCPVPGPAVITEINRVLEFMRPIRDMDYGLVSLHIKSVLAFWGCYNKIQWTGRLISNRNVFLCFSTVLEAGRSKIKALEDLESGEDLLPGS